MDPGVLLGLLVAAVVLAAAFTGARAAVETIGGMFRPPDLGWPAGVQEDDDARWSWTAPTEASPPETARVRPVVRRL